MNTVPVSPMLVIDAVKNSNPSLDIYKDNNGKLITIISAMSKLLDHLGVNSARVIKLALAETPENMYTHSDFVRDPDADRALQISEEIKEAMPPEIRATHDAVVQRYIEEKQQLLFNYLHTKGLKEQIDDMTAKTVADITQAVLDKLQVQVPGMNSTELAQALQSSTGASVLSQQSPETVVPKTVTYNPEHNYVPDLSTYTGFPVYQESPTQMNVGDTVQHNGYTETRIS